MYLELAYSGPHTGDSALLVYGTYIEDNSPLGQAIARAGWHRPQFVAPRMPEGFQLTDTIQTETYLQPSGSALFGGQTEEESKRNFKALRSELSALGHRLGRPRKMSIQECL